MQRHGPALCPLLFTALASVACDGGDAVTGDHDAAIDKEIDGPCEHAGQAWPVGTQRPAGDGCCTCEDDGTWACGPTACDTTEVPCELEGGRWSAGQERVAADGCNRCVCQDDGAWSCTTHDCREVRCTDEGTDYPVGAVITRDAGTKECLCLGSGTWQCHALPTCHILAAPWEIPLGVSAPVWAIESTEILADARCNTCRCVLSEAGLPDWECTDIACGDVCMRGSAFSRPEVYAPGESFAIEGGTCTCEAGGCEGFITAQPCSGPPGCVTVESTGQCGTIACTLDEPPTCEYAGRRHGLAGVFPGSDGCDLCRCDGPDAVTCEERACPACDGGDACDPGCVRFFAARDSLACELQGGVQCPEGQVAFFDAACGCGCEPAP